MKPVKETETKVLPAKVPTTVAEIGKLAGCSGATVSRVLNNSASVKPEIRDAIYKIIRESRYTAHRPGRRGRPLKRQQGQAAGLVEIFYFRDKPMERLTVNQGELELDSTEHWSSADERDGISSSFYQRIIHGASGELADRGYKAVIQTSTSLTSAKSLADVNEPDRAGILLLGEYSPALERFIEQCVHPLVLVDIIHYGQTDVITTDNLAGISQAFDHLYSLGHRKIGFIGKVEGIGGFTERFTTYKWKMAEKDLPVNPAWVYEGPNRIDQTEVGVTEMLKKPERPTAFLCGNDIFAMSVLRAANKLNIRIPQELSVVGFDDVEAASLVTPALTTVRTPVVEMGRQAVRQLMQQITFPQSVRTRGACVRLIPELVIRQSTAAVK